MSDSVYAHSFLHLASKPALLAHFTNSLPRWSKKVCPRSLSIPPLVAGLSSCKIRQTSWVFRPDRLSCGDNETCSTSFFVHDKKCRRFSKHML